MIRKTAIILFVVLVLGLAYGVWTYLNDRGRLTTAPEYTGLSGQFVDNVLQYPANPAANISFAPEYSYVGGQKFILYGAADVEQHFFIKADSDGRVESAFLLQFESVRPGIEWQYDYSNAQLRSQISDFDFFTDVAAHSQHLIYRHGKPGSDFNLEQKFLAKKGYKYPKNYMWARMVHLPTADKRKELLIVFTDDLGPTGFTRRTLAPGGKHEAEWANISRIHLEKMQGAISITKPN